MNDWREDNFLERLARSSRKDVALGQCPSAESLCAKIEDEGSTPRSNELTEHIRGCPTCSEILRRVARFEQIDAVDSDAEAIEAERRLDSWMKGFLSLRSLHRPTPAEVAVPKAIPRPSIPKPRSIWSMQWAFAAAATVIIVASLVYIRRSIIALAPVHEVAQNPPGAQVPKAPPERPPVEEPRPATSSGEIAHIHKPPRTSSVTVERPSSVQAPEAPKESGTEIAMQKPPTEVPSPQAANGNPTVSPTVQPTPVMLGQEQSGQVSPPSDGGMNSRPQTSSPMPSKSGLRTSSSSAGVSHTTFQPPIHLPAGTRVWLTLSSVNPLPGGRFEFHANLLLSVTDASGGVLFEKGAQVLGSGQTIDGKTSVQIAEIASRGLRYRSNSSQSRALNGPAAGKAVSFQGGQVLETWLDSPSTFSIENSASTKPQQ
jgi:hypothetical protein